MSVSLVVHPHGPNANSGAQIAPAADWTALQAALQNASAPIVIDAAEGEGRSLATIVAFIKQGGVWVSYGGFPFYYTPSYPGGNSNNFGRFCRVAGIPDPGASLGGEFFDGKGRNLVTTKAALPKPWIAAGSPFRTSYGLYGWTAIGVPIGKGWWFYAPWNPGSGVPANPPADYATFILQTINAASPTPLLAVEPPVGTARWKTLLLVGGGIVVAGGATALIVRAARSRR